MSRAVVKLRTGRAYEGDLIERTGAVVRLCGQRRHLTGPDTAREVRLYGVPQMFTWPARSVAQVEESAA